MKKRFAVMLIIFINLLFTSVLVTKAESNTNFTISKDKNVILVDVFQEINTSNVIVNGTFGDITLNQAQLISNDTEVSISNGMISVSSKGVFSLDFQYLETSFPIYIVSKLESETEYVLYEENFDQFNNGSLPDDYKLIMGNAEVFDGGIKLNAMNSSPTQLLLPSYLKQFSNYIIESDFTIQSANEPTRWASIFFRYETSNYYQMAIRKGATAYNGVEFAKYLNNQWNVPSKINYNEDIQDDKWYKLKIDVLGPGINEYINDEKLITYEDALEFETGNIGLQANGSIALYDNIKITLPVDYLTNDEYIYRIVPNLYEPQSNIIVPPSVIKPINNSQDLESVLNIERPATAIFRINQELNVIDEFGEMIFSITDALNSINGQVIPAFFVEDIETARSIATFLKENKVIDVFVVSNNAQAVKTAREEYDMVRGVIQFEYDESKPNLTDADLAEIRNTINKSNAIIALLPHEYSTQHNVFYLQKRLTSVWSDAYIGNSNTYYQVILSGVNGLITSDFETVFDIYKTFPENSILRKPILIGHRGIPKLEIENTIEGAQLAFEKGVDVVELDIHLTKDNEVVVFHDFTTERLTGENLKILDSTLEELKELTLKDSNGINTLIKIPTLNEFFEAFKDSPDVFFFVEIKSYDPIIVDYLKSIVSEYEMENNIAVISFHDFQINKMKEVMPEISNGYLAYSGLIVDNDTNLSVSNVLNTVIPINTTLNPSYIGINEAAVNALNHRGITIWPWGINEDASIKEFIFMGVSGITTDNGDYFNDVWISFESKNTKLEYYLYNNSSKTSSQNISLEGEMKTGGGLTYETVPLFEIIDSGNTGIVLNENGKVVSADNPGTAHIKISSINILPDGTSFVLYGDVVTIEVIEVIEDIEEGNNNLSMILIIGIGSFTIIGGTIIVRHHLLKRNR